MELFKEYFEELSKLPLNTQCTADANISIPILLGINELMKMIATSPKIIVIGNGGSASIASHCASHYPRNGGLRIMALNDIAAMTATANDFGYENSYAMQIEAHADERDLLIAISSSGNSENILNAVKKAKELKCKVITFSGKSHSNKLRKTGDLNFWVPSENYGHVELTHMALLHAAFDFMEVS